MTSVAMEMEKKGKIPETSQSRLTDGEEGYDSRFIKDEIVEADTI